MNIDLAREDRRARLAVAGVIAIGVLIRLAAVRAQGFPTDVGTFQAWAERLAEIGPGRFYDPSYFSDYPPAFLYVLWLLGAFLDGEPLRLAVKAISIPADIGIAVLAARLLWRSAGRSTGIAAAALWSLQPGPIFAGPYWGQVDAVGTLPLFASLVAAGSRRWWLAGMLAALAALVKPQFGIGLFVIVVAAAIEFVRDARWRPIAAVTATAAATAYLLAVPFWGPDPVRITNELAALVRGASETYPYTSLYAFNGWSVFFEFWKPDDALVRWGAALLIAGLIASSLPLWWRRDTATVLACGVLAALAFYFLPTRAHERYLFPVFALALPLAAARTRLFPPYATLALGFAATLYFAFTRYQQYVDLRVPEIIEATLFGRNGQIAIALLMMAAAAYLAWRLARGDARLESDSGWSLPAVRGPSRAWALPAGLGPGRLPTRRDVTVALLVALAVLLTRGYRLDWPRDMYFDEVYHARTAFELLAEREPYEWTHPHLAKEIMALGILAFGDDRVVGHEAVGLPRVDAFAVGNDGTRARLFDGTVSIAARGADPRDLALGIEARAIAIDGDRVLAMTDSAVVTVPFQELPSNARLPQTTLPFTGARSFAVGGGRAFVGAAAGVAIYARLDGPPVVAKVDSVALTAKPDGSEVYALDPQGVVHVIAAETGQESRALTGGRPGTAIAYVDGPNRIFVARAETPTLDVYDLETGGHEAVPLANARTGSFSSEATALAVVSRTDFLYALADGRLVVIETHGASPFASIPVRGSLLGVDGEGDKLLVAGGDGVDLIETGRHAIAWRLPGVLFAALLAFLLVLMARRLFASPLLPALAGLAVLFDGSMFAQARIGMNDVYVGALIVAGWYFVVAAHRPRRSAALDLFIAGMCFGLAFAAKWAAVYALVGVAVAVIAVTVRAYERGRKGAGGPLDLLAGLPADPPAHAADAPSRFPPAQLVPSDISAWLASAVSTVLIVLRNALTLFVAFAALPAVIYLASYLPWFGGKTIPYGWDLVELTKQMYWYHSSLTAPHPAGSPWWSWPLVLKPVYWYFGQSSGGDNAYIYDAGNVVLFWGGLIAFGWCALAAVRARSIALGFVVFAALAQYVAWIPIGRVLFFYHFFTALPFYLLALAAGLAYLCETGRTRWAVVYLGVAAAAFAYFYPFISGQPFPGAQAGMFFILPTWTYDCQFYPTFVCSPAISSGFDASALFARLAFAVGIAALVALLVLWSGSPAFSRLLAIARPDTRR
ncbi:MAG TPA: phospholipid carrier-dependent glycosyltransferase [Candidatus Limnocylindria bacterium]|jgi:Gpi18-like mannosyltransferase/predicted membrane-bound dolichyl-phosphate-mannose-protein mannosyltransferase|nr:phospholipid carrier-dependent glycosyltransferase [Candidatus Limnocylindria bacterium]